MEPLAWVDDALVFFLCSRWAPHCVDVARVHAALKHLSHAGERAIDPAAELRHEHARVEAAWSAVAAELRAAAPACPAWAPHAAAAAATALTACRRSLAAAAALVASATGAALSLSPGPWSSAVDDALAPASPPAPCAFRDALAADDPVALGHALASSSSAPPPAGHPLAWLAPDALGVAAALGAVRCVAALAPAAAAASVAAAAALAAASGAAAVLAALAGHSASLSTPVGPARICALRAAVAAPAALVAATAAAAAAAGAGGAGVADATGLTALDAALLRADADAVTVLAKVMRAETGSVSASAAAVAASAFAHAPARAVAACGAALAAAGANMHAVDAAGWAPLDVAWMEGGEGAAAAWAAVAATPTPPPLARAHSLARPSRHAPAPLALPPLTTPRLTVALGGMAALAGTAAAPAVAVRGADVETAVVDVAAAHGRLAAVLPLAPAGGGWAVSAAPGTAREAEAEAAFEVDEAEELVLALLVAPRPTHAGWRGRVRVPLRELLLRHCAGSDDVAGAALSGFDDHTVSAEPPHVGGPRRAGQLALPVALEPAEAGAPGATAVVTLRWSLTLPMVRAPRVLVDPTLARPAWDVALEVMGHRGAGADGAGVWLVGDEAGAGAAVHRRTHVLENTMLSFEAAAAVGCRCVEFDVHLTRDGVPVVHHDWDVLQPSGVRVPITRLTAAEFLRTPPSSYARAVPPPHVRVTADGGVRAAGAPEAAGAGAGAGAGLAAMARPGDAAARAARACAALGVDAPPPRTPADAAPHSLPPGAAAPLAPSWTEVVGLRDHFMTFATALARAPASLAFDVEVKYPEAQEVVDNDLRVAERNSFVDAILRVVARHAGARPLFFSSFDPDVCALLAAKQCRYPVLFLTEGGAAAHGDRRMATLGAAVRFARAAGLAGVVTDCTPVLARHALARVGASGRGRRLTLATYGSRNNAPALARLQLAHGVDMVCVDHVAAVLRARHAHVHAPAHVLAHGATAGAAAALDT